MSMRVYLFCARKAQRKKKTVFCSVKSYKSFEMYKKSRKLHKCLSPARLSEMNLKENLQKCISSVVHEKAQKFFDAPKLK